MGLTTPHVLCDGHGNKETTATRCVEKKSLHSNSGIHLRSLSFQTRRKTNQSSRLPFGKYFFLRETVVFMGHLMVDFVPTRYLSNRNIFFPKKEVERRIKAKAMENLRSEQGDNRDVWITSSDTLLAFCFKVWEIILSSVNV